MFLKMNWEKNYIDAFVSSIPILTKKQETERILNFNNEIEMYNKITNLEKEIEQLYNEFLGNK